MTDVISAAQAVSIGAESLWAFGAIVVLWAVVRPNTVRDNDNRPLPVEVTARFFIIISYVGMYLMVIAAAFVARDLIGKVVAAMPRWELAAEAAKYIAPDLEKGAPFLALFLLGTLMTLSPVREMERSFLVWAHNARHLHADVVLLTRHLVTCGFTPSEAERQQNMEALRTFNIFLTDSQPDSISLTAVDYWRKASSLVRLVRSWRLEGSPMLNAADLKLLDEIETALQRKTKLATDILRMLTLMARGEKSGQALSEISAVLSGVPHGDPGQVAAAEARLEELMPALTAHGDDRPVRLSSRELSDYFTPIQGYFAVEFRLLLERIAPLAAKSVALAGPQAAERLDALKAAGFKGLGRIEPIRVDRILALFLFVLIGGFLIFYALRYQSYRMQTELEIFDALARDKLTRNMLFSQLTLSLVLAAAALLGAMFGSGRSHARAAHTPWGAYCLVGLLSVLAFFLVHGARLTFFGEQMSEARQIRMKAYEERLLRQPAPASGETVTPGAQAQPSAETTARKGAPRRPVPTIDEMSTLERLGRQAPLAVLPFLMTVVICWLARLPGWPQPWPIAPDGKRSAVWERLWDGAAVASICFVAYVLSRAIRELVGLQPPPWTPQRALLNWQFLGPLLALGFFIGAIVVREVRSAAHAQIVDTAKRRRERRLAPVAATEAVPS